MELLRLSTLTAVFALLFITVNAFPSMDEMENFLGGVDEQEGIGKNFRDTLCPKDETGEYTRNKFVCSRMKSGIQKAGQWAEKARQKTNQLTEEIKRRYEDYHTDPTSYSWERVRSWFPNFSNNL